MVAKEVSTGITKFSGFIPLLNVKIATPYDKRTIPITAIIFETQITARKLNALEIVQT
jgi:hypothetical protein